MTVIDVTDATFQVEVLDRSQDVPVIVDLWAEWCQPCKTLGPILEKAINTADGQVVLAKIDVDANPAVSQEFRVQSIPAVYAMKNGVVVDSFMGAYPERAVQRFVDGLLPTQKEKTVTELLTAGDEASLRRALDLKPASEDVIVALGELLVASGRVDEALQLLGRIPESERTRKVAAMARSGVVSDDDHDTTLSALLPKVKLDETARQQFLDILELMGGDHPRTAEWRRKLTAQLY